jgi:predicted nucleic acid-binding protein
MEPTNVLIDTNLFIEHNRARDKAVTPRARIQEEHHQLVPSSIAVAELCYGARSAVMRAEVDKVLFGVKIVPSTAEMAFRVSIEVERLKTRNAIMGFRDLAIACVALLNRFPIATRNQAEFGRVEGLLLFDLAPYTKAR